MWIEAKIYQEDFEYILHDPAVDWNALNNKNILVSGATGLIGSTLVNALLYADEYADKQIQVYAIVRNVQKAKKVLHDSSYLHLICQTVEEPLTADVTFDYIIHGASPTASDFFMKHPVETIQAGVLGTMNLLDIAKKSHATGFVYLSSMEAYGEIHDERPLTENDLGMLDLQNVRNCYPETKRLCEMLCVAAHTENHINANAIRLAQTFGPGIAKNDKRVFAMMARCAMTGKDIVLATKGESKHPYLYTAQAVTAILAVLTKGAGGEIYNAANPKTYCSIYEMGEMVCRDLADNKIQVKIDPHGDKKKYPAPSYLNLDVTKLEALGWESKGDLAMLFQRMMKVM